MTSNSLGVWRFAGGPAAMWKRTKKRQPIRNLHVALIPFVGLLRAYIASDIDPEAFEQRFFALYREDRRPISLDVFHSLDGFFADVDAMVVDPRLRCNDGYDLSPEELRSRAIALLEEAGFVVTGSPELDVPDAVRYLGAEIREILPAGRVGLYEFLEALRSDMPGLSSSEMHDMAEQALRQLLADGDTRLIWAWWAEPARSRDATGAWPTAETWDSIGDGYPYLAITLK